MGIFSSFLFFHLFVMLGGGVFWLKYLFGRVDGTATLVYVWRTVVVCADVVVDIHYIRLH